MSQTHRAPYSEILARIKSRVAAHGQYADNHKALYDQIPMDKSRWSLAWNHQTPRASKRPARFTFEQINKIADALEAPAGWPYIDWDYADVLRLANERRAETHSPPSGAGSSAQPSRHKSGGHK